MSARNSVTLAVVTLLLIAAGCGTSGRGFESPLPQIEPPLPPRTLAYIVYAVKERETLHSIGRKFGISADDIRRENEHIGQGDRLRVGQILLIPRAETASRRGAATSARHERRIIGPNRSHRSAACEFEAPATGDGP